VTCPGCGNNIAADERFCRVCGRAAPTSVPAMPSGVPMAIAVPSQTSTKAIISLVCGILFFFPISIVAIICGHLALSEIRRSAGRLTGQGIAIAGLVLGYLGTVAVPFILIIAAIAIPNLLRARMAANESSAVASVRTLVAAESSFSAAHSDTGFTCSLSDLAQSQSIDEQLADGKKNGYAFELKGCVPGTGTANEKFQVVAHPVTQNTTGTRAFCSDESAVIKVDASGSAAECLANGSPL
jgi:type IV pilus assembly protein PilA